eukprot:bmy_02427T0
MTKSSRMPRALGPGCRHTTHGTGPLLVCRRERSEKQEKVCFRLTAAPPAVGQRAFAAGPLVSTECKFTCTSGQCLYLGSLVCNQQNDCGDNSDEENCLLVTEHPPPGIFSYFDAYRLVCGFMFVEKTQLLADLAEAEERHVHRCNNFNSSSACKTFWIPSP